MSTIKEIFRKHHVAQQRLRHRPIHRLRQRRQIIVRTMVIIAKQMAMEYPRQPKIQPIHTQPLSSFVVCQETAYH